jgi:HNH endonuclease.
MANNAGRSGRRWSRLKAEQRAKRLPCWLCGQPIDYSQPDPNHGDAFSVDHEKPWSSHPELREDPANLRSAHQRCNKRRGDRAPSPGLGSLSEQW